MKLTSFNLAVSSDLFRNNVIFPKDIEMELICRTQTYMYVKQFGVISSILSTINTLINGLECIIFPKCYSLFTCGLYMACNYPRCELVHLCKVTYRRPTQEA